MVFKKLHLGTAAYSEDIFVDVVSCVAQRGRGQGRQGDKVWEAVQALALCHKVTPVFEETEQEGWESERPDADQGLGVGPNADLPGQYGVNLYSWGYPEICLKVLSVDG